MGARVTLVDIAEKAGVCRTTVYKVINEKGMVSDSVRDRVFAAMDELGYKKNVFAASLASQKTTRVVFVGANDPEFYFWRPLLRGIERAAELYADFGLQLETRLALLKDVDRHVRNLKEIAADPEIAGVIVFSNSPQRISPYVDQIVEAGKKVIAVNRDLPQSKRSLYVGCDYYQSGRLGGEVLGRVASKSGALLVLGGSVNPHVYSGDDALREQGFREALNEYTSENINKILHLQCREEKLYDSLLLMLRQNPDIMAVGDTAMYSIAAIIAAIHDARLPARPKLLTYDLYEQSIEEMQKGNIDVIIGQDLFHQGYIALKQMFSLLSNDNPQIDDLNYLRLEAIFHENLKYYL